MPSTPNGGSASSKRNSASASTNGTSSTVSGKASKASTRSSPSGNAHTKHGYDTTNSKLRSVLAHPLGLPLTAILNKAALSPPTVSLGFDLPTLERTTNYDSIFSNATSGCNGSNETALTKELVKCINDGMEKGKNSNILAENEVSVKSNHGSPNGRVDILISNHRSDGAEPKSVLTLIEFSMDNQHWWKKLDQCITYADILCQGEDKKHIFDKPMLLAAITVEKLGSEDMKAKFGVFLCSKKKSGVGTDFRMSLLWRADTDGPEAASEAFGKLLHATFYCGELRDGINKACEYQYLGPNCCRYSDQVRNTH